MNMGWTEILLLVGIGVLLFGSSRLPGLGKSMGEAIRGFKRGITGEEDPHPTREVKETLNPAASESLKKENESDKQRQS